MFEISKEFGFEAAHRLDGLEEGHPCSQLHGHSYKVIVVLQSVTIDEVGFVKDYRSLDVIKDWIDTTLDHKNLNEAVTFNPTAEGLAYALYNEFAQMLTDSYLVSVTVKETEKTSATYRPKS